MKRLSVIVYTMLALGVVFTLLNFNFKLDISLAALPLAAVFIGVLIWASISLLVHKNVRFLPIVRKMSEYLPFIFLLSFVLRRAGSQGTSFALDLASIITWLLVTAAALTVLHFTHEKRVFAQNPPLEAARAANPFVPLKGGKKVVREVFEWVDAFVQAAFLVSLINIFVIQLYVIPSESMVPEFLVGDRVIVFKTASGPKFPLSDVGIPRLRSYARGDIVVFRNPHYPRDRQSEVKNFVSQLVYMLTFMAVNLNVDEYGNAKPDPLVKRVTGLPGEQLVMVDGVLYSRTEKGASFEPVTLDAQWAAWDLAGLPESERKDIKDIPITQNEYNIMLEVEKARSELDLEASAERARKLVEEFTALRRRLNPSARPASPVGLFTEQEKVVRTFLLGNDSVTRRLVTVDGGLEWFTAFMTEWIPHASEKRDPYAESMFRLDVMLKLTAGNLITRNASLLADGVSASRQVQDIVRLGYLSEAQKLDFYTQINDRRNMPVFPEKDAFIPKDCYFMMGDNRFNSLDLRHSYDYWMTPVSPSDPYSLIYYTNLEPQYLPAGDVLGTTVFRFWPLDRLGIPQNN